MKRVVRVTWDDHSFAFGTETPKPVRMVSVGFLVTQTERGIVLAQSIGDEGEPHEQLFIDQRMIRKVKRV